MKKILLFIVITTLSSAQTFKTDVTGVGVNAASFLEIGVSARATGMGGAYTSIANDVSALYYNPAGIVWIGRPQVEVMHNKWLVETAFDFTGMVVPLPDFNSAVGISFTTIGYGQQPVRTVERPEGTGEFYDARDFAVGLTYALALTDRFSFGLSAKYINQRIWTESGGAFAADLGIFYNTQIDGLRMGFSISNFGTELQMYGRRLDSTTDPDQENQNIDRIPVSYKTTGYPLPLLFRAGISYGQQISDFASAVATLDVQHPSNSTESVSFGLEAGFFNLFYLRGGYENLFEANKVNGLSLGAGLDYFFEPTETGLRFDYAWTDWGVFDYSQRFSVTVVF